MYQLWDYKISSVYEGDVVKKIEKYPHSHDKCMVNTSKKIEKLEKDSPK